MNAPIISDSAPSSSGDGVFTGTSATVTNSGTITAGSGNGIFAGSNATVINSGTISGSIGIHSAVFGPGIATVTNSGTIIGTGGTALQFSGAADTLNLLPGSKIIGLINLAGGGDTVNVFAPNQNLTFDTLAGANIASNLPFVVAGNRIVTVDPTLFAMADLTLMDFTRAVSGIVAGRTGPETGGGGGAMAFAPTDEIAARIDETLAQFPGNAYAGRDAMVFKAPTMSTADGRTVWARGFGGERTQQSDGTILRNVTDFYGGAIGLDGLLRSDLRVGAFLGGGATRTTITEYNAGSASSDIIFGGLYGRYDMGLPFLDFALFGGSLSNRATRANINNNVAVGGLETATASYGGWFISPEIAYGYRYRPAEGWSVTPAARVRYLAATFDNFTETGSTANLTAAGRSPQDAEERGDITITRTLRGDFGESHISAYGGVLGCSASAAPTSTQSARTGVGIRSPRQVEPWRRLCGHRL